MKRRLGMVCVAALAVLGMFRSALALETEGEPVSCTVVNQPLGMALLIK